MFDAVMNLKKDLYTKLLEKLEIKLSVEERELEGIYIFLTNFDIGELFGRRSRRATSLASFCS